MKNSNSFINKIIKGYFDVIDHTIPYSITDKKRWDKLPFWFPFNQITVYPDYKFKFSEEFKLGDGQTVSVKKPSYPIKGIKNELIRSSKGQDI